MNNSLPKIEKSLIEKSLIDEVLIDELVSGQLSGERYRAALRAFDAEPSKWRDCALAFLEEQALRSDLLQLSLGTIDWSAADCPETSAKSAAWVQSDPHRLVENKIKSFQVEHAWSSKSRAMLSTAALLLVSFTVGWLGAEVLAERERTMLDSTANYESEAPATGLLASPSLQKRSPKVEPGFFVDRPGAFDRGIPDPIRELERNGRINVKTYDMFIPTTLNDGSQAFVPVQQMVLSRRTVEY